MNTNEIADDQKIAFIQACGLLVKKLGCTQEQASDKVLKVLEVLTDEG